MKAEVEIAKNPILDEQETKISLKILKTINFVLFASFWIIVIPYLHLITSVKISYSLMLNNYICYIFITAISATSLLYLCKHLVIYSNSFVKFGIIGLALLTISWLINYSGVSFLHSEILPLTSIIIMILSIQQVNYTQKERLSYLFIMFSGITISSLIIGFSKEFNAPIRVTTFDQIMPFLGVIIGLYLLIFQISIFKVLLIILAEIILILISLQNIHADNILTVSVPIVGLLCTLVSENKRLGLSFILISAIVLFIAHFLDFYAFFNVANEYNQLSTEISSSFKTAINNIFQGTGFGTFSFSHLEQNPNYYLEYSPSVIFKITTECGIIGLFAWFILMNGLANLLNNAKNIKRTYKSANFFLLWPFGFFLILGHYINNSVIGFIILTYIIWHIGSFKKENFRTTSVIALSNKGLSTVSISIFTTILLAYFVISIIAVKQMNDLETNHNCEEISGKIINPIAVSFDKTKFEFQCIYETGKALPSSQLLNIYLKNSMKEIVPYNPTIDFFNNINEAKLLFDKEDQTIVKNLILSYYPEIWTDEETLTDSSN